MSKTCRLFIAVPLSDQVKHTLQGLQQLLKQEHHPVKWVAPETMHLTLQFLGEIDTDLVPQINDTVQHVAGHSACHTLKLANVGAFPHLRRPSVLWVGVGGQQELLVQLQVSLAQALASLGFSGEARPFCAHLTIGRVRRDATSQQQAQLGHTISALPQVHPISWTVTQVTLFQSELLQTGPRYTALYTVMLPA